MDRARPIAINTWAWMQSDRVRHCQVQIARQNQNHVISLVPSYQVSQWRDWKGKVRFANEEGHIMSCATNQDGLPGFDE